MRNAFDDTQLLFHKHTVYHQKRFVRIIDRALPSFFTLYDLILEALFL